MGNQIPVWSITCQKLMIDKRLTKRDLAKKLKINYVVLVETMSGARNRDDVAIAICKYLGVER